MKKDFIYELNKEENRLKKREYVKNVFNAIAPVYDLINSIMSMGLHHSWRKKSLKPLNPGDGFKALDIASGTCDFALETARAFPSTPGLIVPLDLCWEMVIRGREKVKNSGFGDKFHFCLANAEDLPFSDSHFDIVTISWGIRNTTDISRSLKEIMRILKPGGNFVSLDLGKPEMPIFKELYNFYLFKIVPCIGKLVYGKSDPYDYFSQSLLTFPSQKEFQSIMNEVGFVKTEYKNFIGGAMAVQYGTKPLSGC